MRVADRIYHEECLSCTACGAMLSHSCFIRDLKLYCRTDYERIFGVKCARCLEKVSTSDLVMRPVSGLVFHVECFACCMCGQPLPRGAHYVLRQGQPICRRDFEREMYLNSPQGEYRYVCACVWVCRQDICRVSRPLVLVALLSLRSLAVSGRKGHRWIYSVSRFDHAERKRVWKITPRRYDWYRTNDKMANLKRADASR